MEVNEVYWYKGKVCTREEKARYLDEECESICNKCKKPEPVDNFIGSVNFSGDYHISPEAGDVSYIFDDTDDIIHEEYRRLRQHRYTCKSLKGKKGKK